MRKLACLLIALSLFFVAPAPAIHANERAGGNPWQIATGDLVFGSGGMSGRFLVFDDWTVSRNYTPNTIIKHNSAIWVALDDPTAGEEPGTASSLEKTHRPT